MFGFAKYLLGRIIGSRTRSSELHELRQRLLAPVGGDPACPAEVELALKLRRQRVELTERLGSVESCASCVRPRSMSWPGGHCCSGRTRELFTDDELTALRLAGTTPAQLTAPHCEHHGCAFRGVSGCSLDAMHRPNLCTVYLCHELESELERRGDGQAILKLQQQLWATFGQFLACRQARIEAEALAELERSLL